MTKEDTAPGLLSKMVKFVRNPATNWSDLDQAAADREDSVSKQLLKEMIERKRRNDFVRKREFDMLRKLRKREAMVGTGQDPGGRPSFFQSSMPSKPDDRASTLKKIDEIEAQMSMQWWKNKNNGGATPADFSNAPLSAGANGGVDVTAAAANSSGVDHSLPLAYRPTEPASLQSAASSSAASARAPAGAASIPVSPFRAAPVQLATLPTASAPFALTVPAAMSAALPPAAPMVFSSSSAAFDFSASKFQTVEVGAVFTHDTELEEAAIRFANGDDEGAEAGLLEILAPSGLRHEHAETWLTLFDLYRASAQQDKFEIAAIQFVERFNRSAPQWFSMPELVKQLGVPAARSANSPAANWICPSVMGIQTIAALKAALLKADMPWCLDWSNLKTIEAGAVEPLYDLFSKWAAEPVQLRFMGDSQLHKVLRDNTPSDDRSIPQNFWQLRMQALRVTCRPDDFELAALDFCVTYEVSPPAWESARCSYKAVDPAGGTLGPETIIGDVFFDAASSNMMMMGKDSQMDSQTSLMPAGNVLGVELSGTIQGDPIAVLDKLAAKLQGADIMVISCAKLIRVDFSAAGTLLNWVSERQAENRAIQFSDVNRLVAAFFNVIGISEHAKVVARVD